MNQTMNICDIVQREAVDEKTAKTTYKIKGGGIVNVKSLFGNEKQFKDAIYPAILKTFKQNNLA
jgi:hypothetical protein